MRPILYSLCIVPLLCAAPPKDGARHIRVPVWAEAGVAEGASGPGVFTATIDGQPARVLGVQGPSDDLIVILVLDFAGDLSLVETAKQAAIEAVQALPEKASVTVLRAQDGMRVMLDPAGDREAVAQAIRDLPVSGKAGLLDSVEGACRIADRIIVKTRVRAAVLYLTDSSIYNYREDYTNPVINSSDSHDMSRRFPEGLVKEKITSLEAKMTALQAPLFIVHVAYRTDRLEQAYQTGLLQLAVSSGGNAAFSRSIAEIPEGIAAAFARVASHYSVDVQPAANHARTVQVQIESSAGPLTYRSRFSLPSD
jgi:hypothetical protein